MAWEVRNGRRYLYRGVRRAGRVVKENLGRGPVAELADRVLTEARQARQAEAEALRAEQETSAPLDRMMDELDAACGRLVAAVLFSAGFWRPNYTWRHRNERFALTERPTGRAGVGRAGRRP
jgi:hypothetical protein